VRKEIHVLGPAGCKEIHVLGPAGGKEIHVLGPAGGISYLPDISVKKNHKSLDI